MQALYNKGLWDPGWGKLNPDGKIGPKEVEIFTCGQCHALALAVAKKTGWPFVALDPLGDSAAHCGVRAPDGRIIDVEGGWDARAWQRKWAASKIVEVDTKEVESRWSNRKGGGMHPPTKHAKLFVDEVLKRAGIEEEEWKKQAA